MAVDGRRAGRVVTVLLVAALAATATVLAVAGVDKNAEITALRSRGVPVEVTVTSCVGLMGGSGSNAAGYACRGTFRLGGRPYSDAIPGSSLRHPGEAVRAVTDPGDPALLSTPGVLAGERASWRVFVLPGVLLLAAAAVVGTALLRRRRAAAPARQLV